MTDRVEQIFVVGNSRSGTSLMADILGLHSDVFTFEELHFFEEIWDPHESPDKPFGDAEQVRLMGQLLSIQAHGYFNQKDWQLYADQARARLAQTGVLKSPPALFAAFLAQETALRDKRIACDQTPRNVFYIAELLSLYPNARIINMIRDPRDIVLSQKFKWRRRFLGTKDIPLRESLRAWSNYHPITISMLWNSAVRAGGKLPGDPRVKHVYFEQFVRASEAELIAICDFLGIAYEPGMLAISHFNSSHSEVKRDTQGVDPSAAQRWRSMRQKHNVDLTICQTVCRERMIAHGYPPEPIRTNYPALALALLTWPLKTGLAFILNFARMRNAITTLRKRLSG